MNYLTKIIMYILLLMIIITLNYSKEDEYNKKLLAVPLKIKIECVNKLEKYSQTDSLNRILLNLFSDTLADWKRKELKYTNYNNYFVEKIYKTICFNTNKDKAIIFKFSVDTSIGSKFCFIDFNLCVHESNEWRFYTASMTDMAVPKVYLLKEYHNTNKNINLNYFDYLEAYLRDIIAINFFLDTECSINQEFVNSLYREDTKEKHEEFLNGKGAYSK